MGSAPRGYRVKQACQMPQNVLALLTTHVIHCLIDGLLFSCALSNSLIFNRLKLIFGNVASGIHVHSCKRVCALFSAIKMEEGNWLLSFKVDC